MLVNEKTTSEVEVVSAGETETSQFEISFSGTPILRTLSECRAAIRWLDAEGPTPDLPSKFTETVKKLEKLGFVYRRNKSFCLRPHRLRKVIAHESSKLGRQLSLQDLLVV